MLHSSPVDNIHQFWFGARCYGTVPLQKVMLWFGEGQSSLESSGALDYIESHFLQQIKHASSGGLTEWQHDGRGSLALILLLDQFPRLLAQRQTSGRDCRRYALRYCKEGLQAGLGERLNPAEQCCFYSPLLHSINAVDRQRGLHLLEQLLAQTGVADHPHHEQNGLVRRSLFAAIERNTAASNDINQRVTA